LGELYKNAGLVPPAIADSAWDDLVSSAQTKKHVRNKGHALFIAPIMPSDHGNGLAMRAGFLLDTYARVFRVDLAVIPIAGGELDITPFANERIRRWTVLPPQSPDTHFSLIRSVVDPDDRIAAFRLYGLPSSTAWLTNSLEASLKVWVEETCYDLVHISRLYLSGLVSAFEKGTRKRPYLVLDCDEDDARFYQQIAKLERRRGHERRARWAEAEAKGFKRLADQWVQRFDVLLASSTAEGRLLGERAGKARVIVIPNVVPNNATTPLAKRAQSSRREILFVGNMSYAPNADGVIWFASHVWPSLRSALPFPLRFIIVGSDPVRKVRELSKRPDIIVAGRVEDLRPIFSRAALAVVPIWAAGGMRIKILEAAACGLPIVTTSIGAAGTGLRHRHELLVADHQRAFAAACVRMLTDRNFAFRIAMNARRRVRWESNPEHCARRFYSLLNATAAGESSLQSSAIT